MWLRGGWGGCSLGAALSAVLVSWWLVLRPSGWRPRSHPSSRPSELRVRSVGAAERVRSLAGSAGPACAGGKEPSEASWGHMHCPGVLCKDPLFCLARSPHQRTKERDRDFSQFTWDSGATGPHCQAISSGPSHTFVVRQALVELPYATCCPHSPSSCGRCCSRGSHSRGHHSGGSWSPEPALLTKPRGNMCAGLSVPFRKWGVPALAVPTRGLYAQAASTGSGPGPMTVPLLGWAWGWGFRVGRNRCLHVGRCSWKPPSASLPPGPSPGTSVVQPSPGRSTPSFLAHTHICESIYITLTRSLFDDRSENA